MMTTMITYRKREIYLTELTAISRWTLADKTVCDVMTRAAILTGIRRTVIDVQLAGVAMVTVVTLTYDGVLLRHHAEAIQAARVRSGAVHWF